MNFPADITKINILNYTCPCTCGLSTLLNLDITTPKSLNPPLFSKSKAIAINEFYVVTQPVLTTNILTLSLLA